MTLVETPPTLAPGRAVSVVFCPQCAGVPCDPLLTGGSVDLITLYAGDPTAIPNQTAVVTAGPASHNADGTWTFTLTVPPGAYWPVVDWDENGSTPHSESLPPLFVGQRDTALPRQETCGPWATVEQVAALLGGAAADTTNLAAFLPAATGYLFERSGRQFPGVCESTVRPYGHCACGGSRWVYGGWGDLGSNGIGAALARGTFGCGCQPPRLDLGVPNVLAVECVLEDGLTVDPLTYRLDDHRYLSRLNGLGWASCCQRLDLASTEVGTLAVTVAHGAPPPPLGVLACAALASSLAKRWAASCTPSERVSSLVAEGVTVTEMDPKALLGDGLTGVREADLFLASYDPKARSVNTSGVWSPDVSDGPQWVR